MSLDTYDNLKAEIIDWSHREDMDLRVDTFIDLAESEMFSNPLEPLKIREQEDTASFTCSTTSRYVALPTDYKSMRTIQISLSNSSPHELRYRTPAQLNVSSVTGLPSFFTVTTQIEFERTPDQAYSGEIWYHSGFTALSSSNTTNNVLTNHPDIYLFGSLWALKKHCTQYGESDYYYKKFLTAIKGANKDNNAGRYGPAPVMRREGRTP